MKALLRLAAALALTALPSFAHAQVLIPTDPSLSPLAIKSQRVTVEVKDQLARTHIEQVFVSNVGQQLEATYIFPIPNDVAVSEFSMWMNGKKVQGDVLEADKARGIYESIVARMRDPGLLEYAGQRLLRCRVYPIPPKGEQKIEVEYGEVTKIEDGVGRYTYPLATGGKSTRVQDTLALKLILDSKVEIKSVYSPTHKVSVDRKDDHHALVGYEEKGASLDRDFDVFYTVSDKDIGMNLLTFRDSKGEDGYFVVMMAPKAEIAASDVLPKDVIFVIDSSGSMDGGKMDKAKEALRFVLGTLKPKDRFNIIRFSTGTESYKNEMVEASSEEITRAKKFVDGIEAAGGTAIDDALAEALKMTRAAEGRPEMVVFLTDGEPTIGETNVDQILANAEKRAPKGVRIFDFGVGTDLNAVLLDALANQHGGVPEYATAEEEIEAKISGFASKINSPVMTDLAVDFGKTQVYDVYPKQVPDLFKGGQVTIFGRYKGSGATAMTLTGALQGKKQSFTYEGKLDDGEGDPEDATSFIPRLWATRKVGYLLDEIRLKGEKPELRDEVVTLAKKWGIMTPYTSYLVAEDVPVASNFPTPPMPIYNRAPGVDDESKSEAPSRTDSHRGWFGGLGAKSAPKGATNSSGAGGGEAYYPAAAEPMPADATAQVATRTGDTGVAVSKKVKEEREKDVLDSDNASNVTRAGGRTFVYKGGVWIDAGYKGSEKVVKVKYLSEAWFSIVRLHPEMREALSVGDKAIVVTGRGKAIVISDDGAAKLTDAEIKAIF
jgi:Ca-activated chloride channel family protein